MLSLFFFASRRRHTRCALVTGVQTCALPIFPRVGAAEVDDLERDVADQLAVEPVLHEPGGELVPLDLAGQRRRVRADRHGDRRLVDMDLRQRTHVVGVGDRSEEHTSELQSLMRISYAVFCLKKKKETKNEANPSEEGEKHTHKDESIRTK